MTIKLAACESAIRGFEAVDINDVDSMPDTVTDAWIGVDLTALSPHVSGSALTHELSPDRFLHSRLAATTKVALGASIDFVTIGSDLEFGHPENGVSTTDAASIANEVASLARGGVFTSVHPDAEEIERVRATFVAGVPNVGTAWRGISVRFTAEDDLQAIKAALLAVRKSRIKISFTIPGELSAGNAQVVTQFADFVRVRSTSYEAARTIRFELLKEMQSAKRSFPVLGEVGVLISASRQAAEERREMIREMLSGEIFKEIPSVIGTVYDVADFIETWVGAGAVDGVVLHAASLPTDLGSIVRGVIPLLEARTSMI